MRCPHDSLNTKKHIAQKLLLRCNVGIIHAYAKDQWSTVQALYVMQVLHVTEETNMTGDDTIVHALQVHDVWHKEGACRDRTDHESGQSAHSISAGKLRMCVCTTSAQAADAAAKLYATALSQIGGECNSAIIQGCLLMQAVVAVQLNTE